MITLVADRIAFPRAITLDELKKEIVGISIVAIVVFGALLSILSNILRSCRVNALLHEKGLLGQKLAGLQNAHALLRNLVQETDDLRRLENSDAANTKDRDSTDRSAAKPLLPDNLDQATRLRLEQLIGKIVRAEKDRNHNLHLISRIERLEALDEWTPGEYATALANIEATRLELDLQTRTIDETLEAIKSEIANLSRTIASMQNRDIQLRNELTALKTARSKRSGLL